MILRTLPWLLAAALGGMVVAQWAAFDLARADQAAWRQEMVKRNSDLQDRVIACKAQRQAARRPTR